jgi:hypothetical protein
MKPISLNEFYQTTAPLIPDNLNKEIGHFNVFEISELQKLKRKTGSAMPYNRRAYYKISLIRGRNRAEYADKVIDIEKNALLFATPKIPYHYVPQDDNQSGCFCIFTADFLVHSKSGVVLDELPFSGRAATRSSNWLTNRWMNFRTSSARSKRNWPPTTPTSTTCCATTSSN